MLFDETVLLPVSVTRRMSALTFKRVVKKKTVQLTQFEKNSENHLNRSIEIFNYRSKLETMVV